MATTVVFVHGITVRRTGYDRLLTSMRFGFRLTGDEVGVLGCYWGDLASIDGFEGRSLPRPVTGSRGLDGDEDQYWWDDPLAGLAHLRDPEDLQPLHGLVPMPEAVERRNQALALARPAVVGLLVDALPEIAPDSPIPDDRVTDAVVAALDAAAQADRALTVDDLREPVADAVAAGLFAGVARGPFGLHTEFHWTAARTAVLATLDERWGQGQPRGGRDALVRVGAGALTRGLRWGGRRSAMSLLALGIGDVLVHAAHRLEVTTRLHEQVRRVPAEDRLVLVGHSLGGVIAFEYARTAERPIDRLVTVGTQIGLFGELGVYGRDRDPVTGRLDRGSGAHTWVNLYDPDDALGFAAAPIFPDVTDVAIDTLAPFPMCHSAYWDVSETYRLAMGTD